MEHIPQSQKMTREQKPAFVLTAAQMVRDYAAQENRPVREVVDTVLSDIVRMHNPSMRKLVYDELGIVEINTQTGNIWPH